MAQATACPSTWSRRSFVALDALPLTPNGKVDRKALPDPEPGRADGPAARPAARADRGGARRRSGPRCSAASRVGVHDNFFELGGHSLLAAQVLARVRETFGVELPLKRPLRRPDRRRPRPAGRGGPAIGGAGSALPPLTRVERVGPIPASFAQQRLWFLDQLEPGSPSYNIPAVVRLTGALDVEALERALRRGRPPPRVAAHDLRGGGRVCRSR